MHSVYLELKKDVGRRIAELRASCNWTQEMFAEKLNVTLQYIQRIEQGHSNLTLFSLVKIAAVLDVPISHFFSPPQKPKNYRGRPKKNSSQY